MAALGGVVAIALLAAISFALPPAPVTATGTTCDPPRPHASGSVEETIVTSDGLRQYRLYVPQSYTGADAVPLILNFHGLGSSALGQELYTGLWSRADEPDGGFIVAHPEGINESWNNVQVASSPDDVAFIAGLLDLLQSSLCIDVARVFSTGMSNGALMSVRLACSLSDRIAAIAPVAGAYFPPLFLEIFQAESCPDTRPVPIIAFHGTADTTVPFNGGLSEAFEVEFRLPIDNATPDDDVMSVWAAHNGCTSGRQETQVTAQVSLVRYQGCDEDATVDLYVVDGGGHTWPDATVDISSGKTTHEISANDLMWEFFQAHSLGQGLDPTPTPTPKDPNADTDGDAVLNGSDPDDDNDGCTDVAEDRTAKGSASSGGHRDPHNFWDVFDTDTENGLSAGTALAGTVTIGDIFAVAGHFGDTGDSGIDPLSDASGDGYHTRFDRGDIIGANDWNRAPADGAVTIGDIFAVAAQFGLDCS